MTVRLSISVERGKKYYVARIPELGVTTQGKTLKEAKANLKEALELHLESVIDYFFSHHKVIRTDSRPMLIEA